MGRDESSCKIFNENQRSAKVLGGAILDSAAVGEEVFRSLLFGEKEKTHMVHINFAMLYAEQ